LTPAAEADPASRLMTLEDLAQYLAVSPRWVYDNHQSLGMPALRIGRTLRFRRTQIDAWLDTRSTPADPAARGVRA
jgi:excisionase family DNA binding protein